MADRVEEDQPDMANTTSPPQSFFSRLGLPETAAPEEIEKAWDRLYAAGNGCVDGDLRQAYEYLREPSNLEYYRDLLKACDEDVELNLSANGLDAFLGFCRIVGVRPFQRPWEPTTFKVRRDGQAVPSWVRHDPAVHRRLTPSPYERWIKFARRFLLFEVFKGRTFVERVYLFLGYALLAACIVLGVRWTRHAYDTWQVERAAAAEGRALDDVQAAHRAATNHVVEMQQLIALVEREFTDATQLSLADVRQGLVNPPRAVDLAMIVDKQGRIENAWRELKNGALPNEEWSRFQKVLADVGQRVESRTPQAGDQQAMVSADIWLQEQNQRLRSQRARIAEIRDAMQRARSEFGIGDSSRSDTP